MRIGIIGAGSVTEWAILPALSGPDALAPPDTGAWWARRPTASSEIRYQAPAQPEVVAIADADRSRGIERARRLAQAARIGLVYDDWRQMLRETTLDALVCAVPPPVVAEVALAAGAAFSGSPLRWLWVYGPPAASAAATVKLAQRLEGQRVRLWCARPLRQAAAHRAARQLLERDEIGPPAALTLRWGVPLPRLLPGLLPVAGAKDSKSIGVREDDEAQHFAAAYAALDLLLAFAASPGADAAVPARVLVGATQGAASLWARFASEVTATTLFASAESWSAPLPRLEICGTEGRTVVCEAGRRLWLHKPREAARLFEPPGLAPHLSAANLGGIAEDLKAFLAALVAGEAPLATAAQGDKGETPPGETLQGEMLRSAARALQLLEAACESLGADRAIDIAPLRDSATARASASPVNEAGRERDHEAPPPATLPLLL